MFAAILAFIQVLLSIIIDAAKKFVVAVLLTAFGMIAIFMSFVLLIIYLLN